MVHGGICLPMLATALGRKIVNDINQFGAIFTYGCSESSPNGLQHANLCLVGMGKNQIVEVADVDSYS